MEAVCCRWNEFKWVQVELFMLFSAGIVGFLQVEWGLDGPGGVIYAVFCRLCGFFAGGMEFRGSKRS